MVDLGSLSLELSASGCLEPFILQVRIIHVHRISGLLRTVIGMNLQAIVWTVEGNATLLAVADSFFQKVEGKRVEELVLDGPVERTSAVDRRVPNAGQILLRSVVQFQGDLARGKALLDFFESDVDDGRNAIL